MTKLNYKKNLNYTPGNMNRQTQIQMLKIRELVIGIVEKTEDEDYIKCYRESVESRRNNFMAPVFLHRLVALDVLKKISTDNYDGVISDVSFLIRMIKS